MSGTLYDRPICQFTARPHGNMAIRLEVILLAVGWQSRKWIPSPVRADAL